MQANTKLKQFAAPCLEKTLKNSVGSYKGGRCIRGFYSSGKWLLKALDLTQNKGNVFIK